MLMCLEFANCIRGPCYSGSLYIFLFLILLIMILVLLFCSISPYFSFPHLLSFLHASLICFHFHLSLTRSHLLLHASSSHYSCDSFSYSCFIIYVLICILPFTCRISFYSFSSFPFPPASGSCLASSSYS